MPSLVMLPFIQCHQTRGRAELGGFSKPDLRGSEAVVWAGPVFAKDRTARTATSVLQRTAILLRRVMQTPPRIGQLFKKITITAQMAIGEYFLDGVRKPRCLYRADFM